MEEGHVLQILGIGRGACRSRFIVHKVEAHVFVNRRFTADALREVFPYVLRSVLYETVTVQVQYRKMANGW
jgi:hypothetical protein